MVLWILMHAGETAARGGGFPPLHPILVNFTAALIPTSVAADLLGRVFHRESLRATAWWTLLLAAALTPLTVLLGWLWMRSMDDMDDWQMSYHKWLGIALALAFVGLAGWRGWLYRRDRWPGVPYFLAGFLLLGALAAQGELGGAMSFGNTMFFADKDSGAGHGTPHSSMHSDQHDATDGAASSQDHGDHRHWSDHIDLPTQPAAPHEHATTEPTSKP